MLLSKVHPTPHSGPGQQIHGGGGVPNLSAREGDLFLHIKATSHQEGLTPERVRFAALSKDALLLAAALTVSPVPLGEMRNRVHRAWEEGRGPGGPRLCVFRAVPPPGL